MNEIKLPENTTKGEMCYPIVIPWMTSQMWEELIRPVLASDTCAGNAATMLAEAIAGEHAHITGLTTLLIGVAEAAWRRGMKDGRTSDDAYIL